MSAAEALHDTVPCVPLQRATRFAVGEDGGAQVGGERLEPREQLGRDIVVQRSPFGPRDGETLVAPSARATARHSWR